MENMTRTEIAGHVVKGCTHTESVQLYEDKFLYGGNKNACIPNVFVKHKNIMLIQRQTLCDSFRANATKFAVLQDAECLKRTSAGKVMYYRIRKELLEGCVFRMAR
jgi:prolyl oligopeptidase PreP (S9A serine peptidase family)